MTISDPVAALVADLESAVDDLVLVVTGAGVSHASGIATFRGTDPEAIWTRDVVELGTNDYFRRDPVGSWRWYLERFDRVLDAEPNPGHRALVELEQWQTARGGRFLLVTQNVDPLHERAGSRELVKVHGSADRVRCSRDGCRHGAPHGSLPRSDFDLELFRAAPLPDHLPRCPACDALLRQHVLWFDEFYDGHDDYRWGQVQRGASEAALVLFVGTSFSVGVTELVLTSARWRGAPVYSVDPATRTAKAPGLVAVPEPSEELLPALCARLGASHPRST